MEAHTQQQGFSDAGKAVRFRESDVRAMGRNACGVRGIRLREGQSVIAMILPGNEGTVFTVTANGYGKRTPVGEFPRYSRGAEGVIAMQTSSRNGALVGALLAGDSDEVMLVSDGGTLVRTRIGEVSVLSRNTQGVKVISLTQGEKLVGVDKIEGNGLEEA